LFPDFEKEMNFYNFISNQKKKEIVEFIYENAKEEHQKPIAFFIYKTFKIKRNISFSKLLKGKEYNPFIKFLNKKYEEESETMSNFCKYLKRKRQNFLLTKKLFIYFSKLIFI
jgi:hypothetical protein